jgi:hypothetical protein
VIAKKIEQIVDRKINAMEQLIAINERANRMAELFHKQYRKSGLPDRGWIQMEESVSRKGGASIWQAESSHRVALSRSKILVKLL